MNISFTALLEFSLSFMEALFFFSVSYAFSLFCVIKIVNYYNTILLDLIIVLYYICLYCDCTELPED